MTKFLASAATKSDVDIALKAGADIIDLKDPANGALGAASEDLIRHAITTVNGAVPVSAAVGDASMDFTNNEKLLFQCAQLGVDFVKIGIPDTIDQAEAIDDLMPLTAGGVKLIAVFYADQKIDPDLFETARGAAFQGVMFDTSDKTKGSITNLRSRSELRAYISEAHRLGLLAGLAGSIRSDDVEDLLKLNPDTLGFRGALTEGEGRLGTLSEAACKKIRNLIPPHQEAKPQTAATMDVVA